jgi:hypothetical protein
MPLRELGRRKEDLVPYGEETRGKIEQETQAVLAEI